MLTTKKIQEAFPDLPPVIAIVEVNGKKQEMTFITNHTEWAASSVCDLYQSRWEIEVFFKQIKQNLKLCDFLSNSANAVGWQSVDSAARLRAVALSWACERLEPRLQPLFTLIQACSGIKWLCARSS
ncbi:MAG: hypothetical protein R3F19_00095 [Verrucomicrobiales bacterium]